VGGGDFGVRADVDKGSLLAPIAAAFNVMAERGGVGLGLATGRGRPR
jgi:hypothetical protein